MVEEKILALDRMTGQTAPQPASLMQKRRMEVDNANETSWSVEYCWLTCPGKAHVTGMPDAPSHFCNLHVHRSGGVILKDRLTAAAEVGKFT